jgi:hypothetical protein
MPAEIPSARSRRASDGYRRAVRQVVFSERRFPFRLRAPLVHGFKSCLPNHPRNRNHWVTRWRPSRSPARLHFGSPASLLWPLCRGPLRRPRGQSQVLHNGTLPQEAVGYASTRRLPQHLTQVNTSSANTRSSSSAQSMRGAGCALLSPLLHLRGRQRALIPPGCAPTCGSSCEHSTRSQPPASVSKPPFTSHEFTHQTTSKKQKT